MNEVIPNLDKPTIEVSTLNKVFVKHDFSPHQVTNIIKGTRWSLMGSGLILEIIF